MRRSLLDFALGRTLASREQTQQKMGVLAGFPAMGLDGLSSSAYGPEAALTILLPLGAAGLVYIGPIMIVILALLTMLYFSYRQTIAAYPVNGGSYTVAKENLGTWAGLLAAAALLIDYVLNAAVGISAGVAALVSAAPSLHKYTVPMCIGVLVLITLLNLRGTGEAGLAFALPTYVFIATMVIVLAWGIVKAVMSGGHPQPVTAVPPLPKSMEAVGLWILLRSFASGCTAMTGVEAVSNGVSAFKDPPVKNAHITLTAIVGILAILLGLIAYLAHAYHIGAMDQSQPGYQSVLSQLTGAVAGRGWFYKVTICSVLTVLCLSANTSFVDFPRLCRLIAKDEFLPRAFAAIDRRLVYSVGVLVLSGFAVILLVAFRGITDRLIPLFAVGAFLAFTLSQAGMVMHWRKQLQGEQPQADKPAVGTSRENVSNPEEASLADAKRNGATQMGKELPDVSPSKTGKTGGNFGMHLRLYVNAAGAISTGVALVIILAAKFVEGAWIIIVAIPMIVMLFHFIHRHYQQVEEQIVCHAPLDVSKSEPPVVLVPMRRWDKPLRKSLRLGMFLSPDVEAIHLSNLEGDAADDEAAALRTQWAAEVETPANAAGLNPPKLHFSQTPYREFVKPLMKHIYAVRKRSPHRLIAVVIPEIVERRWWLSVLHSRRASRLRNALRKNQDGRVIVIDLPWFVGD